MSNKQIEAISLEQAAKLALEALERYQVKRQDFDRFVDEIAALREALAEQPAQQEPTPIGRPHRAVMGDYGAKLVNQRIEEAVAESRKMQAKAAETPANTSFDGGGRQPAQQEPTESVLVDGVAYVIPAAVAYELLHLHLQIEASRTEKQEPLTDEQCDAIYTALDEWAKEFDPYEFGLPSHCGDGMVGGRSIIRKAAHGITKGNT